MDKPPLPGHERLGKLLRTGGGKLTTREVASAVGTDSTLVSRWAAGTMRPGLAFCLAIEQIYGIPAECWLTPEEAARIATSAEHRTAGG